MKVETTITVEIKDVAHQLTKAEARQLFEALKQELTSAIPAPALAPALPPHFYPLFPVGAR